MGVGAASPLPIRRVRLSQTPVISNAVAYAAKDVVGALLTFANAARPGVLSTLLESVTIVDKGQQMAALDLVLFTAAPTVAADNAIFAPTDGELSTGLGTIEIAASDYNDFSTNSLASARFEYPLVLTTTSLFGVLVARGTPTYTSVSDLVIILGLKQD